MAEPRRSQSTGVDTGEEIARMVGWMIWACPVWAASLVAMAATWLYPEWPAWQRVGIWVVTGVASVVTARWQARRVPLGWLRVTLPEDLVRIGIKTGGAPPRIVRVRRVDTGRELVLSSRRGHSRALVERHRDALAGVLGVERITVTSDGTTVTVTTLERSAHDHARPTEWSA